jgi:hypothetical protein
MLFYKIYDTDYCSNRRLNYNILLNKWTSSQKNYNKNIVEDLIMCKKSTFVSKFREIMVEECSEEMLKRYYSEKESVNRLLKITAYFEENLRVFANLCLHYENKYIFKNIYEKQKLIDRYEINSKKTQTLSNAENYLSFFTDEIIQEIDAEPTIQLNQEVTKVIPITKNKNNNNYNNNDSLNELIQFIFWAERNTDNQTNEYSNEKPSTLNINIRKHKENLMKNIDADTLEFRRKNSVNLKIEKRCKDGKIFKFNKFVNNISKNFGEIITNVFHKKDNGKFKKTEDFIHKVKEKEDKEFYRLQTITNNFFKEKEIQYKSILNFRTPKNNKLLQGTIPHNNENIYFKTVASLNSLNYTDTREEVKIDKSRKKDDKKINSKFPEKIIFKSENKITESHTLNKYEYSPFIINKIDFEYKSNICKNKLILSNKLHKTDDKTNQFINIKRVNLIDKGIMTGKSMEIMKKVLNTNYKNQLAIKNNLPYLTTKINLDNRTKSNLFNIKEYKKEIISENRISSKLPKTKKKEL